MTILNEQGVANHDWKSFDQMPEAMLLWLCTPKGWDIFKKAHEEKNKPKSPLVGRRRKRARMKTEDVVRKALSGGDRGNCGEPAIKRQTPRQADFAEGSSPPSQPSLREEGV